MSKLKRPTEGAPDFIASEQSRRIAVDDFIEATATDARANQALGLPLSDALAQLAKTREPRRADIDEWIRKQLAEDSALKSPDLWGRAPQSVKDYLSLDAFKKRVTGVRKQRR